MNKKGWTFIILALLIFISVLISTGCGKQTEEDIEATVVQILVSTNTPEPTSTPEPTPLPPWYFADEYSLPELDAFDEFAALLGFSEEDKQKIDVHLDIAGNNVWAGAQKPENFPESAEEYSDIIATSQFTLNTPPDMPPGLPWPTNAPFVCGYANPTIPARVVCPNGMETLGTDQWHVGVIVFGADIPYNHPTRYGTINWPLVTEPDTDNRFVPDPAFPNDYYTGTQIWPMAFSDPVDGWEAAAYDSSWNPVDMNFFWIFYRNLAVIYISAADVVLDFPSGRATVDWANPENYIGGFSGDVQRGDASLDPIPWLGGPQVFEYKYESRENLYPEGYKRCSNGSSGCMMDRANQWEPGSPYAACVCGTCGLEMCECVLYVDTIPWDPDTPYFARIHNYEVVGTNQESVNLDPNLQHWCSCLSKTGE